MSPGVQGISSSEGPSSSLARSCRHYSLCPFDVCGICRRSSLPLLMLETLAGSGLTKQETLSTRHAASAPAAGTAFFREPLTFPPPSLPRSPTGPTSGRAPRIRASRDQGGCIQQQTDPRSLNRLSGGLSGWVGSAGTQILLFLLQYTQCVLSSTSQSGCWSSNKHICIPARKQGRAGAKGGEHLLSVPP